jgi:hypothetical protein
MADNVQSFLREFQKYLKQQYRGEKEMDEKTIIEQFIVKKENMVSKNSRSLTVKALSYEAMNKLGKSLLLSLKKIGNCKWSFELRFDGNGNGLYRRLLLQDESMRTNVLELAQT